MHFSETAIPGAWTIDLAPHSDERGWFARAWCVKEFAAHGIEFVPLQANMGSTRHAGTVRGLHYQAAPHEEAKLIRCTRGAIYDVVIDLRPGSRTYGRWIGVDLTDTNRRMVYVPPLCAHGYQAIADNAEILYLTSAVYAPDAVSGVRFDDPSVAIRWPLPPTGVSTQDRQWPLLAPAAERVDR